MKKKKKKLLACSSYLVLNKEDKIAKTVIAKTGNWKGHIAGPFELKKEDLEQIKKNFDDSKIDVLVDLDHAILEGTAVAYGWVKTLEVQEDTLKAKIDWLPHGEELVKSKKYKYVSPVLNPYTIDEETGEDIGWSLHSVALTNRPFFEKLGEIVANNKDQKGEEVKVKDTDEKIKELEEANKELKERIEKEQEEKINTKVEAAIAANKITKEQKESLIALAKTDYKNFEAFLDNAKVVIQKPEGDLFKNSKGENEKIDVLALGGIE